MPDIPDPTGRECFTAYTLACKRLGTVSSNKPGHGVNVTLETDNKTSTFVE